MKKEKKQTIISKYVFIKHKKTPEEFALLFAGKKSWNTIFFSRSNECSSLFLNKKEKSCTSHRLWTLSIMKRIRETLNYWNACMKKLKQFLHTYMDNFKSIQNKAVNDHHFHWKPLKSNSQKLFLKLGKIFYWAIPQ